MKRFVKAASAAMAATMVFSMTAMADDTFKIGVIVDR